MIEKAARNAIRPARAVAVRALALFGAVGTAMGAPRAEVIQRLEDERLWTELTPREVAFLSQDQPTERQTIDFSWQSERLIVLLWALGRIPALPEASVQCDARVFQQLLPPFATESVSSFLESATLRRDDELLQKADELRNDHRAAREAHLNRRPELSHVALEIVQERHRAIHWIIGYEGLTGRAACSWSRGQLGINGRRVDLAKFWLRSAP